MLIRREAPTDVDAVDEVHARAFASDLMLPVEVALLRALRASSSWLPALSLVAEDGSGQLVGHVVCTRGRVERTAAVALGPIGVLPDHQGRGVGTALMHSVIAAADASNEPLVALLGEPAFYRRFGFVPGADLAIAAPELDWGDYFQVRVLSAYRPAMAGTFRYAEPFSAL